MIPDAPELPPCAKAAVRWLRVRWHSALKGRCEAYSHRCNKPAVASTKVYGWHLRLCEGHIVAPLPYEPIDAVAEIGLTRMLQRPALAHRDQLAEKAQ